MSAPEQHVSILQSEMRRLEEFLGTLSPEDGSGRVAVTSGPWPMWLPISRRWTRTVRHESGGPYTGMPRRRRRLHRLPGRQPQTSPTRPSLCGSVLAMTCCPRFSPRSARCRRPWRPSAQQTGTSRATIHKGASRLGGSSMHSLTNGPYTDGIYNPCLTRMPGCHLTVCL